MVFFALFSISVVEYRFPEDAQRAIRTLHNAVFMGRPVLVREVSDTPLPFHSSIPNNIAN
jgi:RNA recognition motif-containing protein